MIATRRITVLCALFCWVFQLARADILVGSKRHEVIAELGKPTSAASRGAREILLYPGGVRIELQNDSVVDLEGYIPTVATKPDPKTPEASAATAISSDAASPVTASAPNDSPRPPGVDPAEIDNLDDDAMSDASPDLREAIAVLVGMLLAQFLLTFIALKIAFHYHQMDALWSGIFAITGIDVALQAALATVFYFQSGDLHLGIAGTGLPGIVMVWTIRHFCLDQRWKRALGTTSAVKVAAVLLNIGVFMLLAQFGT